MVSCGMMIEPSRYPARSYPSSNAWTWRFYIRKLVLVNFVTFIMLTFRIVMLSETLMVSMEEDDIVEVKRKKKSKRR